MLRSLVGAKNVAANDQLNAIVLRDSADKVKVAENIIATNDKSRGELIVDVELLQIGTSTLQALGTVSKATVENVLPGCWWLLDSIIVVIVVIHGVVQGHWIGRMTGRARVLRV